MVKKNTIKWSILKYYLIIIIGLIALVTIIFSIAVRVYIEKDITMQLNSIAQHAEATALQKGPDFFPHGDTQNAPPPPLPENDESIAENDLFRFYFMLDRSLREPLSVLNADYILLSSAGEVIPSSQYDYFSPSDGVLAQITYEIDKKGDAENEKYISFSLSGREYIAVIKPVSSENTFDLGWIIIYSSLEKLNQLQWNIYSILLIILVIAAIISAIFSTLAAKKITVPFFSLNQHISTIAERNFGKQIEMPVYEELREFVNNINVMSEKLGTYDKAQKTFLQNVSHEFRTPLMSIQSYAEGIQYDVVDSRSAAGIIIDEAKRMNHLVEDLLYLSRLDAIEENYQFDTISVDSLITDCIERVNAIAQKNNIRIIVEPSDEQIQIKGDEEKLLRGIMNILANCIQYAKSFVKISLCVLEGNMAELEITNDGPAFEASEPSNIFERFYKGKKGNFGLGLTITKNIIEKHGGEIMARNIKEGVEFIIRLPIAN